LTSWYPHVVTRRVPLLLCLAALLLPQPEAEAQLPLPLQVVPLVAGGAGWQSDVAIANLSSRSVTVGLRMFPARQTNTFDGSFTRTLTLAQGETLTVPDAVSAWFPELAGRRGFLLVADATPVDCTSSDWPYPALLAVSSRLSHTGAAAAVEPDWLRVNVTAFPSVLVGLPPARSVGSGRVDVTVGVANLSTGKLPVRVDLVAGDGRTLRSAAREVLALSEAEWSLAELGLAGLAGSGRIEVVGAPGADPCVLAALPPPCAEPCDRSACPQRYRLPAAPAFVAFALVRSSQGLVYQAPLVDYVGAQRAATMRMQSTCPQARPAARILDLFGKLVLLHEPPGIRKVTVEPAK
jgi:hypothetical protein